MKNCIVIPSLWSAPDIENWQVFDHPTPIDEASTLGRTLDNFVQMAISVPVILFPAPSHQRIEQRVKELIGKRNLNLHIFSISDLERIRHALKTNGFPEEFLETVAPKTYGSLRNLGLLYAALKGYDNVIQIDDDELIEDPDYFHKAERDMGKTCEDALVWGKTGYYLDEHGRKYYEGQLKVEFKDWPKDRLFNEGAKQAVTAPQRLFESPVAFGGNMVINRVMFLKVPYDPYGTRGEDDDYMLNARYQGMKFFFDQELWVRHLPPERHKGFWKRHRQDIIRFKYTREKTRLLGFKPAELGVFLGHFTQDNLEYLAVSSSVQAALHFVDKDRAEFTEFLNNVLIAVKTRREEMKARAEKFLHFMEAWRKVLPRIEGLWS